MRLNEAQRSASEEREVLHIRVRVHRAYVSCSTPEEKEHCQSCPRAIEARVHLALRACCKVTPSLYICAGLGPRNCPGASYCFPNSWHSASSGDSCIPRVIRLITPPTSPTHERFKANPCQHLPQTSSDSILHPRSPPPPYSQISLAFPQSGIPAPDAITRSPVDPSNVHTIRPRSRSMFTRSGQPDLSYPQTERRIDVTNLRDIQHNSRPSQLGPKTAPELEAESACLRLEPLRREEVARQVTEPDHSVMSVEGHTTRYCNLHSEGYQTGNLTGSRFERDTVITSNGKGGFMRGLLARLKRCPEIIIHQDDSHACAARQLNTINIPSRRSSLDTPILGSRTQSENILPAIGSSSPQPTQLPTLLEPPQTPLRSQHISWGTQEPPLSTQMDLHAIGNRKVSSGSWYNDSRDSSEDFFVEESRQSGGQSIDIKKALNDLRRLPWKSTRIAVDYQPSESTRARTEKSVESWYTKRNPETVDLLANDVTREATFSLTQSNRNRRRSMYSRREA